MKSLNIDLENCYGIKSLKAAFDFSVSTVYAIYAPNGAMKSSLARTFRDVTEGVPSKDRIFPSRPTKRLVTDEKANNIPGDNIFVVSPYDEVFAHTEKTSTLLVDQKLKAEYEKLHVEINEAEERFVKALKDQTGGSKKDLKKELSSTFTKSADEFYRALIRIKDELANQKDAPWADVPYDVIFDDKVLSFLGTKDFRTAIEDYVTKYNELLAASTYFRRGIFNYYNAGTIAKALADNGFFDAKHSVRLNADESLEITSQQQLEDLIQTEKDSITKDKELRKKFAEIEKLITKNAAVRDFQAYLADHEDLLPRLANIESFKEELWKSYLKTQFLLYIPRSFKSIRQRRNEESRSKQRLQNSAPNGRR